MSTILEAISRYLQSCATDWWNATNQVATLLNHTFIANSIADFIATDKAYRMLHKLFLSVGAMKAGTTWLYDKFKLHPEIHFGFEKELHFHAQKYGVGNPLSLERRRRRAEVVLRKLLKSHEHRREVERCIRWYVHFVGGPVDDDWFEQLMTMDRSGDGYIADFSNLTCHLKSDHWMD